MAANIRPSSLALDGERVSTEEVQEGEMIAMRVSWFCEPRCTHFRVVETYDHIDELKLRGTDGHIYRLHGWDGKVICNTDDKKGVHRGNIGGDIKRLE